VSTSDTFALDGVDDTVDTSNADTDGDQEEAAPHEHHFVDHDYSFYRHPLITAAGDALYAVHYKD